MERLTRWIAWHLPRSWVYWATIRLWAHGTTGRWSDQVVNELEIGEALKRWRGVGNATSTTRHEFLDELCADIIPGGQSCNPAD
jgi:hypothetical protein